MKCHREHSLTHSVFLESLYVAAALYSVAEMSEDEMREKALVSARVTLDGKSDLERSAILHQHLGSRVMSDMVIETFQPSAGLDQFLLSVI